MSNIGILLKCPLGANLALSRSEKIGKFFLSRWIRIGSRICCIYASKHDLSEEDTKKVRQLTEYVCGVYFPTW